MTDYVTRMQKAFARILRDPDINKWIISTPNVCKGDARIFRTRLTVMEVVDLIMDDYECLIYQDYPYITEEMVDACIVYYETHYNEEI